MLLQVLCCCPGDVGGARSQHTRLWQPAQAHSQAPHAQRRQEPKAIAAPDGVMRTGAAAAAAAAAFTGERLMMEHLDACLTQRL